jgi:LuxR family transcriptional regulator, maltose regulon positive regulatory protein
VVTALLNELAALPDQLGLVLDAYHLMESQQVHQAVAFLLDHLPPSCTW